MAPTINPAPFIDKDSRLEFRGANGDPAPMARLTYTTSLMDLKRSLWQL